MREVPVIPPERIPSTLTSRNGGRHRLRVMTHQIEVRSVRPASLTSSQLATAERLWQLAGLPRVWGYGSALLAIGVASDPTLADMLPSVHFDDADSVTAGVEALLEWRQRTFG